MSRRWCGRSKPSASPAQGLDVFEVEPLPKESPLLKMENVLLSAQHQLIAGRVGAGASEHAEESFRRPAHGPAIERGGVMKRVVAITGVAGGIGRGTAPVLLRSRLGGRRDRSEESRRSSRRSPFHPRRHFRRRRAASDLRDHREQGRPARRAGEQCRLPGLQADPGNFRRGMGSGLRLQRAIGFSLGETSLSVAEEKRRGDRERELGSRRRDQLRHRGLCRQQRRTAAR